jgi:hypothetical protein
LIKLSACFNKTAIVPIVGQCTRLVESQEEIATLGYVDSFEEQDILEQMLEDTKPPYPTNSDSYHYLLKTPFRYPPLDWGSRFGQTNKPSIFYGGLSIQSTLAESAYYRFVFLLSMAPNKSLTRIDTMHTLFQASYATDQGIKLHQSPFHQHQSELTHPSDYTDCQKLGDKMRSQGVTGFEYPSARNPNGTCVGLFEIDALTSKVPDYSETWLCITTYDRVGFKQKDGVGMHYFYFSSFLVDGALPNPAWPPTSKAI